MGVGKLLAAIEGVAMGTTELDAEPQAVHSNNPIKLLDRSLSVFIIPTSLVLNPTR